MPADTQNPSQNAGVDKNATRFGPSSIMPWGGTVCHPLTWIGILWAVFAMSAGFRSALWSFNFQPWRRMLLSLWDYTSEHPWLWLLLPGFALTHQLIRYATSYFALSPDYLYIQTGLFTFGGPGGPFRVFNDPIPFSTVLDANAQKGLLGLLTNTGTLFVKSSDLKGQYIRLTWVPNVEKAQEAILSKAGVRNARILSSAN